MKRLLLLLSLLCSFIGLNAQNQTLPDSAREELDGKSLLTRRNKAAESLMNPYSKYQKILQYHDPVLYLTFFPTFAARKSRTLVQGEGASGYLLEGNIAHRITLYRGKYYSPKWFRKLRGTFDAGFNLRLTDDESSAMLPISSVVGLGADYLISPIEQIMTSDKPVFWLKAQIHHYSNGQAENFFESLSPRRNNYRTGDFSTNYLRGVFYGMKQTKSGSIVSAALGYQREINIGGPLILSEEFKNSYGMNRVLANLQFTRTPQYALVKDGDVTYYNHKRIQMSFRSEMAYIIDKDLSLYPTDKKYRFSVHNYFTLYPFLTNDLGVILHHYFGRDYLNIRYDDPVSSYQIGMVMNFNK